MPLEKGAILNTIAKVAPSKRAKLCEIVRSFSPAPSYVVRNYLCLLNSINIDELDDIIETVTQLLSKRPFCTAYEVVEYVSKRTREERAFLTGAVLPLLGGEAVTWPALSCGLVFVFLIPLEQCTEKIIKACLALPHKDEWVLRCLRNIMLIMRPDQRASALMTLLHTSPVPMRRLVALRLLVEKKPDLASITFDFWQQALKNEPTAGSAEAIRSLVTCYENELRASGVPEGILTLAKQPRVLP